jgi:hypothetical protein
MADHKKDTEYTSNVVGFILDCLMTMHFTYLVTQLMITKGFMLSKKFKIFLCGYNAALLVLHIFLFVPGRVRSVVVTLCHINFISIFFFIIFQMKLIRMKIDTKVKMA